MRILGYGYGISYGPNINEIKSIINIFYFNNKIKGISESWVYL